MLLTLAQIARKVHGKADVYRALKMAGHLLPDIKSRLCTHNFLSGVLTKLVWLPKIDYFVVLPTPVKLTVAYANERARQVLNRHLDAGRVDLLAEKNNLRYRLAKNPADVHFCVALISRLDPHCDIFRKDFVQPRGPRRAMAVEEEQFFDADQVLASMPDAVGGSRKRGNRFSLLTKEQRLSK